MIFALAALAVAAATPTAPVHPAGKYLVHATMSQDGKVLYQPHLTVKAGEPAGFLIGDGKTNYALQVIASPDATGKPGPERVSLSLNLVVGPADHNRRLVTTVVVRAGEPFTLTLPATATDPSVKVDVSADQV